VILIDGSAIFEAPDLFTPVARFLSLIIIDPDFIGVLAIP